ncbi:hypothetical protein H7F43_06500, partial [Streptococcus sp. SPC0]|nr:hypothetical protein [Streptococcus sp. SPC0]
CSLLSLIIGTVVGLSQVRIKRLLTYSTIITIWKNSRPGNRGSKNFKAHLCKQFYIIFIVMIKINCF